MKEIKDNVFLAIPQAVVNCGEIAAYSNDKKKIYNTFLSEPLGFFLVRPVKRLKVFNDYEGGSVLSLATVGYAEIKTGKRIITRTFSSDEEGNIKAIQHDILADTIPSKGDIQWSVKENPELLKQIDTSKIEAYMNLSKDEIYTRLNDIHMEAKEMAIESINGKIKQKTK